VGADLDSGYAWHRTSRRSGSSKARKFGWSNESCSVEASQLAESGQGGGEGGPKPAAVPIQRSSISGCYLLAITTETTASRMAITTKTRNVRLA
jgi:hypothetical protein